MTERNTERVERQKATPITVIIGNPPYNQSQQDENDQNQNRKYPDVDRQIANTFIKHSKATLRMQLYDVYVRFFRWAIDRLGDRPGIVCFISNNGFLDGAAFDGFRKELQRQFDLIYHVDLKGNARTSGERRQREGGNVFLDLIRVGVGISMLVRSGRGKRQVMHSAVPDFWSAGQKRSYLSEFGSISAVSWDQLKPDESNTWLVPGNVDEFAEYVSIGSKEAKRELAGSEASIFRYFTSGIKSNSDSYVYDFNGERLYVRAQQMVEAFNSELDRWRRRGQPKDLDEFLSVEPSVLKWIRKTKRTLIRGDYQEVKRDDIRDALYRPFDRRRHFFHRGFNEDLYRLPAFLPSSIEKQDNSIIVLSDIAYRAPQFSALITRCLPDLHLCAPVDAHQCFPFYVWDKDGTNRRENITDWALNHFREHCSVATTTWGSFCPGGGQ